MLFWCDYHTSEKLPTFKTRFNLPFFKCPISSHENGSYYLIVCFCTECVALSFVFVALQCFRCFCCFVVSSLNLCVFLGFSLSPGFVFSQSIYDLRIAVQYCCLYLVRLCLNIYLLYKGIYYVSSNILYSNITSFIK